jgi:hypothetical protein
MYISLFGSWPLFTQNAVFMACTIAGMTIAELAATDSLINTSFSETASILILFTALMSPCPAIALGLDLRICANAEAANTNIDSCIALFTNTKIPPSSKHAMCLLNEGVNLDEIQAIGKCPFQIGPLGAFLIALQFMFVAYIFIANLYIWQQLRTLVPIITAATQRKAKG